MLSVSAIFGIVAAMVVTVPSYYMITDPLYQLYPVLLAWGISWVGFNVFTLVLALIPFRRGERWAWYTLWMMPLSWLSLFALAPDLRLYLVFAIVTAVGLLLPYRGFFHRPEEDVSAVS